MGLMHTLARLSFDQPPDHADGDAREWLGVRDVAVSSEVILPSSFDLYRAASCAQALASQRDRLLPMRDVTRLDFTVVVDGAPSAETALVVHEDLPVLREQTVHFDDGDMRVVEELVWH